MKTLFILFTLLVTSSFANASAPTEVREFFENLSEQGDLVGSRGLGRKCYLRTSVSSHRADVTWTKKPYHEAGGRDSIIGEFYYDLGRFSVSGNRISATSSGSTELDADEIFTFTHDGYGRLLRVDIKSTWAGISWNNYCNFNP